MNHHRHPQQTATSMTMIAKSALAALVVAMTSSVEAAKLKNVVYYIEWAIYQRKFGIFDLGRYNRKVRFMCVG
ncbi:hypothetical protein DYB34_010842 [Aphanomyces astaci]|uniref:Uncharacterized protein n=1 Tax=Aphanomyces astaci TaxID=112090 RepID=A0A3R6W9N1_APHAT|nr:hypothetical protein DYB34_010842 [Aphanomyces astaci]